MVEGEGLWTLVGDLGVACGGLLGVVEAELMEGEGAELWTSLS